jgi:hypothetical protein
MSKLFRFVESLTRKFWERVAASVTTEADAVRGVGEFRIVFGLMVLSFCAPHFSWIGSVPRAFFDPPILSPMAFLRTFPAPWFFLCLDAIILASLALLVAGYRTRLATWALFGAGLLGLGFHCSFGKIDHEGMFYCLLFSMALAKWGSRFSFDADRGVEAPAAGAVVKGRSLFAVLLVFGMFTAGFSKLRYWVDFDPSHSGFLSWFYPNVFALGRDRMLAPYVPHAPAMFFEAGDYAAAFLETFAWVALLAGRRAWLAWLAIVCSFHLLNTLMLNIAFIEQSLTYLVFADLARWQGLTRLFAHRAVRVGLAVFAGFAALWHFAARVRGGGSPTLFVEDVLTHQWVISWVTVVLCAALFALLGAELAAGFVRARATARAEPEKALSGR